ncbi:MAG: hypothetical protein ACREHG_04825, partial [Candidatus Saccharimonadales bacterium]
KKLSSWWSRANHANKTASISPIPDTPKNNSGEYQNAYAWRAIVDAVATKIATDSLRTNMSILNTLSF